MMLSLFDLVRQQGARLMPDSFMPPLPDWEEEGADLVLRLPLEGIDPRSVQVQIAETGLSLAGHRTYEERIESPGRNHISASYGAFARTVPLPARVLPRESRALWRGNGLLEIRLRKA